MNQLQPISPERREQLFPKLAPAQIERIASVGRKRKVAKGEMLIKQGEVAPFFVITIGRLDIIQPTEQGELTIVQHEPGHFTGELNMLTGRRSLVCARMGEDGEVIELTPEEMQALVQTDVGISQVLMTAFIFRRLELIANHVGDAVVIGSPHSPGTLRIKEFLSRNGHPYTYLDLDKDTGVQEMLDKFKVSVDEIPVLICRGTMVLRNPSNQQVADCLGLNPKLDETQVLDVVIVGAGPAGLAAAVYAASEGLSVVMVETTAPGGQAGSSSKIENYLGFPTGISGQNLAGRAYAQAQKFGAKLIIARSATKLSGKRPYKIEFDDGRSVIGRTVVIASGAQYRKLPLKNLDDFEGMGIYFGATFIEAQLCTNEEVIVVGGGNSAGQAAVFLSELSKHVHMLVRSNNLAETMSRYLIRRIEDSPKITLHVCTEIAALEGGNHLERVQWRDKNTGATEMHDIRHIFLMTGATPNTQWLSECIALDEKGFVRTGSDLTEEDLLKSGWPLERHPFLLETSLPGVLAVGDVRSGNVKRVASAVGEGSISIHLAHKALAE
ncbi:MAG TPA: FAD-dependent oxidoreductase [Methylomirabilota bacterium]|jgi:thioredoxin reductase (NADPH)|nr:FAD-dependent oxidoreductase [Methylomirabilota bacterium]